MRQYRGKTKDGLWVYGYLFKVWEKAYILWGTTNDIPDMLEVIPETIGQPIGLKDKDGKDLGWWEGDLFLFNAGNYKIVKDMGCFWFIRDFLNQSVTHRYLCYKVLSWPELPVKIGNIHENLTPEEKK